MNIQTKQLKLLLQQEKRDLARIKSIQQKISSDNLTEPISDEFEHIELLEDQS